ncbi:response regulator transcription factor [Kibdelosporangium philippinense]|uniref:Response regulator transcription factor n=1 Tax=Kibdelosporangium philippinense TaxID=211113 RepID=A0ABS8ZTI8_9PSEU|nr:response regulator transcription factor [Kibdelosporangium philippinense]MCE7011045.1 response regulator transcription factor [Kibdelosporangium philippinense]
MIRVALADDHELVRMGLRVLIDREPDMIVSAEVSSGQETLQLLHRDPPDVLLLDVRMPGMDGLATLREVPDGISTRVIIVTTFEVDQYIFDALSSGAAGFILKDADPGELVRAIRVVADGDALLSPSVASRVVARFNRPTATVVGLDELTERECEIVAWVATGSSNDEIAKELVVSPATVRTHIGRAMVKLGVRTRAQLVVSAMRAGLTIDAYRQAPRADI